MAKARLLDIGLAYSQCLSEQGRPPSNEDDLRQYLETPEEQLVSPRDSQPFLICYGVDTANAMRSVRPGELLALAVEKEGADGTKWVLLAMGPSIEIEESEFSKITFPPGKKPK